ncbi:MAG: 30S ribosome-binding factor RbfA [Candidatus Zhuqueibacterota bacterium]
MKVKRSLRVSEQLKRILSEIISLKMRDPRIKNVSITSVIVSDDLKIAKIYYRALGTEEDKVHAKEGLENAKKFLRAEIGSLMELRYVPDLLFYYDSGLDYAAHIDSLLEQIKKSPTE